MRRLLSVLFCTCCFSGLVKAQLTIDSTQTVPDTVQLMSGKTLVGFVRSQTDDQLKIRVPKKDQLKLEIVELDLVFAVRHPNGKEDVLYKQDTLFGNYFTPQEVRYFMIGENDARKAYRSPIATAGGFVTGAAASIAVGPFFGLPAAFVFGGVTTFTRVKIRPGTVSNPQNLKFDTYLLGYEKEARKRRMFRSMIAGVAGYATGLVMSYTVLKQTD